MALKTRPDKRDVARVTGQVARFTEKLITTITLEITATLIEVTPVKTGWARVNWVPRIGTPFAGTAGSQAAADQGRINQGPQRAGIARMTNYRLKQGNIFIVNNVPYIGRLNDGSSSQAPAAFVQTAIFTGLQAALVKAPSLVPRGRGR